MSHSLHLSRRSQVHAPIAPRKPRSEDAQSFVARLAKRRDSVTALRSSLCGALRQLGENLYTRLGDGMAWKAAVPIYIYRLCGSNRCTKRHLG